MSALSPVRSYLVARWPILVPLLIWIPLYASRVLIQHYSLGTNAHDLSVFDYALWSSLRGSAMYVPFYGQSLLNGHAMPALWALLPVYGLFQSPVTLLVLQLTFVAAASCLLWRLAVGRVSDFAVAALIAAFLFSRRSHSAIMSMFYIESLEPLLVFGMVLAATRRRWWPYWGALVLALGCKEDMALYIGAFGLVMALTTGHRKVAAATAAVAVVWFIVSLVVVLPAMRGQDLASSGQALDIRHPLLELNYGTSDLGEIGVTAVRRIASWRMLEVLFDIGVSVIFVCFAAPVWLLPMAPGVLVSLGALPDTQLANVTGHYVFPFMPWVFIAGLKGLEVVHARWPRRLGAVAAVLLVVVVADWPGWHRLGGIPVEDLTRAALVRSQLDVVPVDAPVLAQTNLIPHLPKRMDLSSIEGTVDDARGYVLLTPMGDPWPLDLMEVEAEIRRLREDGRYELLLDGPLFVFRLEDSASSGSGSS
ncbi:MAG: DUF2079 domain-containing protein [Acidobacteria bacterium]|nr:DUF2079 domain-containing protein [Acidobacteriota bacterium]